MIEHADLMKHFGSRKLINKALFEYIYLDVIPSGTEQWDWEEIAANYFVREDALIRAVVRLTERL